MPDQVHQIGRVLTVVNRESGIDPDLIGILAQKPSADTVERSGPGQPFGHDAGAAAHNLSRDTLHAPGHFGRGAARKGHQQDPNGPQVPHQRDELYFVTAGTGRYRVEDKVTAVGPGDLLFCAAHVAHGFEDISADLSGCCSTGRRSSGLSPAGPISLGNKEWEMAVDTKDGRTPEQRLRLIEDRFEIYNLIASHPPSADTGAGDYTASAWTEDGVFDRGAEFPRPTGRAAIAGGSSNPEHHRAIEQGIAHFAGLPYVRVTGDAAS